MIKLLGSNPQINLVYVYQKEAHAVDVWPIGLSAGTINYSHKSIQSRKFYAEKFAKEFDLDLDQIHMYLDPMDDSVLHKLSAWPFRYYGIKWNGQESSYQFILIGEPEDAEFNFDSIFDQVQV